jgi:hypothetical protein
VDALLAQSAEFAGFWELHEVAMGNSERKRLVHPVIGTVDVFCQHLVAEDDAQTLMVYTAIPGTPSYDQLQLLAVVGTQELAATD